MGRPPKPIEQKRRLGNPGKRALPKKSSLVLVPAVPRHEAIELSAADAFERVLEQGVHWLAATDLPTLALLREVLERREEIAHDVSKWVELTKLAHSLLAQCGFDPAARAKLGLAEVRAMSKMEQLRAARERRTAEVVDTGQ